MTHSFRGKQNLAARLLGAFPLTNLNLFFLAAQKADMTGTVLQLFVDKETDLSSQIQGIPGKCGVRENTGFNLMFRELSSTVSPWGNDFLCRQRERSEPDRQKFVQRQSSNKPWEQVVPGESHGPSRD